MLNNCYEIVIFMLNEIYDIIFNEMKILLDKMEADFIKNYKKKEHNWILNGFNSTLISNMVFVSSFESKYGNMFEDIARNIVKLKVGEENVPDTVKGIGITDEEYEEYINKNNSNRQNVISKYDKTRNEGVISQFRQDRAAKGRGVNYYPSRLTQSELPKLLDKGIKVSNKIISQPVDLLFYDPSVSRYKLFEIKAGGDLDSSNAPKNIEKMLKIYSSFGNKNAKLYFATLYHKNGEGNTWTGTVKKHIAEDSILIGKNFWKEILPGITFEEFIKIYNNVFDDVGFDDTLSKLITQTAQ